MPTLSRTDRVKGAGPRKRVIDLFEAQVDRVPHNRAVVHGAAHLTYRELDQRANLLARLLMARGVGPGHLVGIAMERRLDLVVALLAVLKSGAAYVAIDPAYPTERVAAMLDSVALDLLLSVEDTPLPDHPTPVLHVDRIHRDLAGLSDERPVCPAGEEDLVYVIFTSGSTGRPKAAGVHHAGWFNLMTWFQREFAITGMDRVLVISSFSFDITQRGLAMPLIVGGELHLLDGHAFDAPLVRRAVRSSEATLINCAPSAFYPLVEQGDPGDWTLLSSLRHVFLGGEAIAATRIAPWATHAETQVEVVNVYGAAECSDVSSFYRLVDYDRYRRDGVPIGRPIAQTGIHLLLEDLSEAPRGTTAEIHVSGAGVGKGYVNDPAATAARFRPAPWDPAQTLYLTGDLGWWSEDGVLRFVGRADNQVKIRGNRVDLGDVESALRQLPEVREALASKVVIDGEDHLRAHVVPEPGVAITRALPIHLRAEARKVLPAHMVPGDIVFVAAIPLTPNGKADRAELERTPTLPIGAGSESGTGVEAAGGPEANGAPVAVEERVMGIFAEVLDIVTVDAEDNFFDLGGSSVLLTEALAEINDHFSVRLRIQDFLLAPTARGIAGRLEGGVA